jgi:hypothetical protein
MHMIQHLNWPIIIAVIAVALALIIFLALRNKRDKKELLPPDTTEDPVADVRKQHDGRNDSL